MQGIILIVDDDTELSDLFVHFIKAEGFEVFTAPDAASARKIAAQTYPDVILLDIMLPDSNGVELLKELRGIYPDVQFIMMTAHATIQSAIESTRLGAFDYLTKPLQPTDLLVVLRHAMKGRALNEEVRRLRSKDTGFVDESEKTLYRYPSPKMKQVLEEAKRAAETDGNLLLTGESGSGKNYLAAWIHKQSPRSEGPFFNLNCASITPSLVESELFGHEPGAFTGSQGRKRGLLELADAGSLLLDEIGDMDMALQAKLLSFLDTHTLRRIGGETSLEVDTRIIAATNRNVEKLVQNGEFRKDLYYRLNVLSIHIPPLRERREDIAILADEIMMQLAGEMGLKEIPILAFDALKSLETYDWQGNVREMRNVLERTLLHALDKSIISEISIDIPSLKPDDRNTFIQTPFPEDGISLKNATSELTRKLIMEALRRSKTKKDAAALLGISRFSLAHYIKVLGIDV